MVMSSFQLRRPDGKVDNFYITGRQNKIERFSMVGFFLIATLRLHPWAGLMTFVPVKKFDSLSLEKTFNGVVKRELSMN